MYNLKNKLKIILKVILIFFVFYYLITNIDLDFIEKLKKYYFLIFIIIPIFLTQIILNSQSKEILQTDNFEYFVAQTSKKC